MTILIGKDVRVFQPSDAVLDWCKKNLVVTNPDYISRQKMGKWTGDVPRKLYLYEERDGYIIVPYGCKNTIVGMSQGAKRQWESYPPITDFTADYHSTIDLFGYQEKAVRKMLGEINGVVIMPCGSGKTQTALEAVARLGLKTLWLTHTQDLLNQSMARAKTCFECPDSMFGTITAGKVKISKGITFATVQTMCKLDLSKYEKTWAVVVVDEVQHAVGSPTRLTQFYRVVSSLYAPYKFGLTATPDRTDGLERSMYSLIGGKLIEIDKSEVQDRTCKVKVQTVGTGYYPDVDTVLNGDGTIDYAALTKDLISNRERFRKVMMYINTECKDHALVLANRVAYLQEMSATYAGKSVCISTLGTSEWAKRERKEILQKLNDGEIDCVFATYQLAAEGLDCPNLRYVVFATPEKNERTVTQAVGRVARKADGKEYGTVIDFVDDFGMYLGWAKKRRGYYKKLGCEEVCTG